MTLLIACLLLMQVSAPWYIYLGTFVLWLLHLAVHHQVDLSYFATSDGWSSAKRMIVRTRDPNSP